jgi:hypothetical protein
MLFRSRGSLCIATRCQVLGQTAGGQTRGTIAPPSPDASAIQPVSEADARKKEEPIVGQEPQPDDDRILISRSNRKEDFVYALLPGVLLGVGNYVQKEYNHITHLDVESRYTFEVQSGDKITVRERIF